MAGPSPRAWGLRTGSGGWPGPRTVHPHVRGVYYMLQKLVMSNAGPSPRAWGLRGQARLDLSPLRSIPTCVGFTLK